MHKYAQHILSNWRVFCLKWCKSLDITAAHPWDHCKIHPPIKKKSRDAQMSVPSYMELNVDDD